MPTDVVMPQMGESITEGTLTKWLKKPGDTVARDEPLFEISTDKVDAEIPSPVAGILGEIKVQQGTTVNVGALVCTISEEGDAAKPATAPAAAAPKEDTVTPSAVSLAASDAAATAEATAPATAGPAIVIVPDAGSTAFTSPPTPLFCQSLRSCFFLASTSVRFIAMIPSAVIDFGSSDARLRTIIRSPTCKSET